MKGTVWTAVAHIVTGVIGSGVLSLPWSTAQLGWLAGPLSVILIASITLFSSFLLCNTYRHPHPEHGPNRSASYLDVVHLHLGTQVPFPLSFIAYHQVADVSEDELGSFKHVVMETMSKKVSLFD